jgi:hypothetical protein
MNRSDRQKCLKACGNALPSHHQATILLLEPGECPLGLEPRHTLFDRSPTVLLGLPDPLRERCPDTPLPKLLPERLRLLAFIRRDHFETLARTTAFAHVHLDRIEQRPHLRPILPIGRRDAVRQRHPMPLGEAVEEHPFALPPAGDARAATLARGNKRHPRRHTPNGSSLLLRPRPESALA